MTNKIIEVIAEYKGISPDGISPDTSFMELGLDSLDIAELIMQIEDELGVTVEVSPALNTIAKLAAHIESKM
ncbi:MAG: acyl carrier protein [Clostridia bacterium]|nr:acyl carrier protein [Clostridia bacterium]